MNRIRPLLLVCASFATITVFYFSWLPNPDIGNLPYFPKWLSKWTNDNSNLRTAVPFIFLGVTSEILFFKYIPNKWKRRMELLLIMTFIVSLAEAGQLFLPNRHFDLADISWGIIGSIIGIVIGSLRTMQLMDRSNKFL